MKEVNHIRPLLFGYDDYESRRKNLEKSKIDKYYIFQKLGGTGQFSVVYRGMDGVSKKQVAIKVLDKRQAKSQPKLYKRQLLKRLIDDESRIMMQIDSQNVLKCYECLQNDDLKLMIIQYCNNGSLLDQLQQRGRLPEDQAVTLMKQIINGISECHRKKIIHRDLKVQNILVHNGQCKIADFGFSKVLKVKDQNQETTGTIMGSLITMAPEVMYKKPYGLKADIWSLGVIFFQMIFGTNPFKYDGVKLDKCFSVGMELIQSLQEYNGVRPSNEVKKFIRQVLVLDSQKRLGWREIMNHEIFKLERKSLPVLFYRQVEMKAPDSELIRIQDQFSREISNSQISSKINESQVFQMIEQVSSSSQKQQQQKMANQSQIISKKQQKNLNLKTQNTQSLISEVQHQKQQNLNNLQFKFSKLYQVIDENPSTSKRQQSNSSNQIPKVKQEIKKQQPKSQRQQFSKKEQKKQKQQPKGQKQQFPPKEQKKQAIKDSKVQQKTNQKVLPSYHLSEKEVNQAESQINREQDQIYKWAQRIHIECLRAEFIYDNIIKVIEKHNLLDLENSREAIEMMFLICTRCRNNISPIYVEYAKRKSNRVMQDLRNLVEPFYRIISGKWNHYSNQLTKKQNEKIVIFRDFFYKRISNQFKKKDRFLTCIQSMEEFKPANAPKKGIIKVGDKQLKEEDLIDYTKEEQIEFTQEFIKRQIPKIKYLEKNTQLKTIMMNFKLICEMKTEGFKPQEFRKKLKQESLKKIS